MAWSEAAREQLFLRRYGPEEGAKRFQEWKDKHEADESVEPQGGSVVQEKAPQRRRQSSKSTAKEMQAGLAFLIAGADTVAANVSQRWASVDRLTGSEQLLQRYLAEFFGGSDVPEVDRLAAALTDLWQKNEWLAKLFAEAKKQGPWLKLLAVISSILVPRMIQAGIIPNPFAPGASPDATAGMEGGGTHGGDRPDGVGQVGADEQPARQNAPDFYSPEVQSRLDQISQYGDGNVSSSNGRPAPQPAGAEAAL